VPDYKPPAPILLRVTRVLLEKESIMMTRWILAALTASTLLPFIGGCIEHEREVVVERRRPVIVERRVYEPRREVIIRR
jgi:hypothetical protein